MVYQIIEVSVTVVNAEASSNCAQPQTTLDRNEFSIGLFCGHRMYRQLAVGIIWNNIHLKGFHCKIHRLPSVHSKHGKHSQIGSIPSSFPGNGHFNATNAVNKAEKWTAIIKHSIIHVHCVSSFLGANLALVTLLWTAGKRWENKC